MLRVSNPASLDSHSSNSFFNLDKRKKQVTLSDPSVCNGLTPEDRRVGVAAPKMFTFDAIFSQEDSQTDICSSTLTDVIHAVINGTDGCLFSFGQAGLGKSYTMLGSSESTNTVGIIPCGILWLFKGINEQKQRTGARFSVRVSAVEISGSTNQFRDLLAGYSNDSDQSPGVYLRDDNLSGKQSPPHCELRVSNAEKAVHYLDAALECRSFYKEDTKDSHFLFTLHVYQYSIAGKGGVAGGRSRFHLIDLGNSDRSRASGGMSLSGVGNVILGILNGQRHLPHKEHKLTQLLKECLGPISCHATMLAHVSPFAENYLDTLTTLQLASRIHRMRRKRIKFVSTGVGSSSGGSSGEDASRLGTNSEPDPSSSDLSADTVIYLGPADEATDGEHPPVYLPNLNSEDNRCSMSKALKGSTAEIKTKTIKTDKTVSKPIQNHRLSFHSSSSKSSPIRTTKTNKHVLNECSDEQWIDGPRISKSKIAEAFQLMKEKCHIRKCETWVDGPLQEEINSTYGYMDSVKKNMIRKWVEHQTTEIQKTKHLPIKTAEIRLGKDLMKLKCSEEVPQIEVGNLDDDNEDEEEPELPPALPLIEPLSSREVSLESLDQILKDRMLSNVEYNSQQKNLVEDNDELLEIIEVEEPLEPVPMQDSCLQVTEEDIALCMAVSLPVTVPLPENEDINILTDLDKILPNYLDLNSYYNDYEDIDNPSLVEDDSCFKNLTYLSRLQEVYSKRLKNPISDAESLKNYSRDKMKRYESLTLSEVLFSPKTNRNDDSSIYSEPVYLQEKFCENCKANMGLPTTTTDWYSPFYSSSLSVNHNYQADLTEKFQRFNHKKELSELRQPDGASNPHLEEDLNRLPGASITTQPGKSEDINRPISSFETGMAAIKTSKYLDTSKRNSSLKTDSIVRDSSIDSELKRIPISHNRKNKCKHKHAKSFCSWFTNPFTCKYIEEPKESHL